MATLTVTHDPAALAEVAALLRGQAQKVNATNAGVTVATFDDEATARMVASTLAHAAAISRLEIGE